MEHIITFKEDGRTMLSSLVACCALGLNIEIVLPLFAIDWMVADTREGYQAVACLFWTVFVAAVILWYDGRKKALVRAFEGLGPSGRQSWYEALWIVSIFLTVISGGLIVLAGYISGKTEAGWAFALLCGGSVVALAWTFGDFLYECHTVLVRERVLPGLRSSY
jgi:hypothetical protein